MQVIVTITQAGRFFNAGVPKESGPGAFFGRRRRIGRDVHGYKSRGRDNYRSGKHRTVVYEHLPSQAGHRQINRLPASIKNAPTPKPLKTRLKRFLALMAFYNVGEFLACNWKTTHFENRLWR
ncbi:hypothetical protein J6590_088181 [Homalodisca vitripennis]|nr:hypothetical protein J6590_088181 [Homalodisca vitripennis]